MCVVAGAEPVAIGGAGVIAVVIPRAAAQDAFLAGQVEPCAAVGRRALIGFGTHVRAPFPHVAVHVVEAELVRLLLPHRVRPALRVSFVPSQRIKVAREVAGRAGAAGILPFGFRRQAILEAVAQRV